MLFWFRRDDVELKEEEFVLVLLAYREHCFFGPFPTTRRACTVGDRGSTFMAKAVLTDAAPQPRKNCPISL